MAEELANSLARGVAEDDYGEALKAAQGLLLTESNVNLDLLIEAIETFVCRHDTRPFLQLIDRLVGGEPEVLQNPRYKTLLIRTLSHGFEDANTTEFCIRLIEKALPDVDPVIIQALLQRLGWDQRFYEATGRIISKVTVFDDTSVSDAILHQLYYCVPLAKSTRMEDVLKQDLLSDDPLIVCAAAEALCRPANLKFGYLFEILFARLEERHPMAATILYYLPRCPSLSSELRILSLVKSIILSDEAFSLKAAAFYVAGSLFYNDSDLISQLARGIAPGQTQKDVKEACVAGLIEANQHVDISLHVKLENVFAGTRHPDLYSQFFQLLEVILASHGQGLLDLHFESIKAFFKDDSDRASKKQIIRAIMSTPWWSTVESEVASFFETVRKASTAPRTALLPS